MQLLGEEPSGHRSGERRLGHPRCRSTRSSHVADVELLDVVDDDRRSAEWFVAQRAELAAESQRPSACRSAQQPRLAEPGRRLDERDAGRAGVAQPVPARPLGASECSSVVISSSRVVPSVVSRLRRESIVGRFRAAWRPSRYRTPAPCQCSRTASTASAPGPPPVDRSVTPCVEPGEDPEHGRRARRQGVEVVPAFEHRHRASSRHVLHGPAVRAAKSPALRPRSVNGSARWASKPAEISSHVGANRRRSGR